MTPDKLTRPPGHFMTIWCILDHPRDVPDAFVLRPQFVCKPHPDNLKWGLRSEKTSDISEVIASGASWQAATIKELREMLPPGLHRMPRQERDPPYLVEVWL